MLALKSYINPSADHRQLNMQRLIALAKTVPMIPEWHMVITEASIRFHNKDNVKSVKIDSSCVLTLDVRYNGKVKSNTFNCANVPEVWKLAAQTLKAFIR